MTTLPAGEIALAWSEVRQRVDAAARGAGRPPGSVDVVAVCKRHPMAAVEAAYAAGARLFGENYAQELARKADAANLPEAGWHFIGHLQRNKAKLVVGRAALIETVDSVRLVQAIARQVERAGAGPQRILLQVHVGAEASKSGVEPSELPALLDAALAEDQVVVEGLMAIPPPQEDPERSRPYFAQLRHLQEQQVARTGTPLPHLSMGMSADFEVAVAEGATLVRVGTAIFGTRPTDAGKVGPERDP